MVTIVIADDHHVVRRGLRVLLETESDFHVVGEASDGIEAIRLVEDLRPNVLVLDLMMPRVNGLEVTRQIGWRFPETSVVILSVYDSKAYVLEALQAGARAYVLKASTWDELLHAIREVCAGRRYLSPPLSEWAIEAYMQTTTDGNLDPYETLTSREREVLQLTADGCTNIQIASRLFISRRTVETHRANLMHKLGLKSQADVLRYALRRGIARLDS